MKHLKLRMTGVCTSCTNWKNCTLLVTNTSPIQQCEEFELSRELTQPDISQIFVQKSETQIKQVDLDQAMSLKGLCMNCVVDETCTLKSKETGVWHCEEYK